MLATLLRNVSKKLKQCHDRSEKTQGTNAGNHVNPSRSKLFLVHLARLFHGWLDCFTLFKLVLVRLQSLKFFRWNQSLFMHKTWPVLMERSQPLWMH